MAHAQRGWLSGWSWFDVISGRGVIMHSALELYIRSSNLKGHVVNVFDCVWHEAFPFSQF